MASRYDHRDAENVPSITILVIQGECDTIEVGQADGISYARCKPDEQPRLSTSKNREVCLPGAAAGDARSYVPIPYCCTIITVQ